MLYPAAISDYMQPVSETVERDVSLDVAKRILRRLSAQLLPVRDHGRPCGVITDRDIRVADATQGAANNLSVGEVMSTDFYPVEPLAPLAHVVRSMSIHGYHCALVLDQGAVRGVFSSADAMRALADFLDQQPPTRESLGPGEVRAIVLSEHAHVALLLERMRGAAGVIQWVDNPQQVTTLRDTAAHLLLAMNAHLELEEQVLAPALSDLAGYGKERELQLTQEHRLQMQVLQTIVNALSKGEAGQPAHALARRLEPAMDELSRLMRQEEELLLNQELLRDDGIVTETTAG